MKKKEKENVNKRKRKNRKANRKFQKPRPPAVSQSRDITPSVDPLLLSEVKSVNPKRPLPFMK